MKHLVIAIVVLIAHSITIISLTTLRGVGGTKFLAVLSGMATLLGFVLMAMLD